MQLIGGLSDYTYHAFDFKKTYDSTDCESLGALYSTAKFTTNEDYARAKAAMSDRRTAIPDTTYTWWLQAVHDGSTWRWKSDNSEVTVLNWASSHGTSNLAAGDYIYLNAEDWY